jgi:16S rRNA processing protein RimM
MSAQIGKMMEDNYLQVGIISSTHGIKGEVKVFPTTNDAKRFTKLKSAYIDLGTEKMEIHIEQVKFFKKMVILKFKEFQDINEVERFKSKSILVTREHAVKLEKDEYFIADLIDICVKTDENEDLGILTDVLETGANDVYVVTTKENKEILIPAIKDCIIAVDIVERTMLVHLLEGLR